MKLYRSIGDLAADALGGVVVIGNFDGIHLGHRTLIETAARLASDNDLPLLVMRGCILACQNLITAPLK